MAARTSRTSGKAETGGSETEHAASATTTTGSGSSGSGSTGSSRAASPLAGPVAAWIAEAPGDGDEVRYGPVSADEGSLRLLGQLTGKRLLLLGSGRGRLVTQVARKGAKVICVEPDEALLTQARNLCRDEGLNLEMYQRDFAELASVRADTVDVVLSVLELSGVADLSRVFRQVHRVLHPEAPLLFSLPHPMRAIGEGLTVPLSWSRDDHRGTDHGHSIEAVFTALVRTGFRVDTLLELHDDGSSRFPAVLLVRARRQGAAPVSS